MAGRSMTYTESDREDHYTASVAPDQCPVCLMGMGSSHGHREVQWKAESRKARFARWEDETAARLATGICTERATGIDPGFACDEPTARTGSGLCPKHEAALWARLRD